MATVFYKLNTYTKGFINAQKDIIKMGIDYAINLMELMNKASGIDEDYKNGYFDYLRMYGTNK